MSAEDGQDGGDRTRHQLTLEGVLKWTMEQGGQADPEAPQGPMDPKRREFLEHVLDDIASGASDAATSVKALVEIVSHPGSEEPTLCSALESLSDWMEDLDLAADLHKVGGFIPVVRLTADARPEVVWRACELLGTAVQNNPECQDLAHQCGVLDAVEPLLAADRTDKVRTKALRVVSCLARGHEPLLAAVMASRPLLAAVVACLGSGNDRLVAKASFFLRSLATTGKHVIDVLSKAGLVDSVCGALARTEDNSVWEQCLGLCGALLSASPKVATSIRETPLRSLISGRLGKLRDLCQEDREAREDETAAGRLLLQALDG